MPTAATGEIRGDNTDRPHSALCGRTPAEVRRGHPDGLKNGGVRQT